MKNLLFIFCALIAFHSLAQESNDCQYSVKIESSDWINPLRELDACDDFELRAVSNDPENDSSYEWSYFNRLSSESIDISDQRDFTYKFSQLGEYPLLLRAVDINGCVAYDSLTVIYDNPGVATSNFYYNLGAELLPEAHKICSLDSLVISPQVTDVGPSTNFFKPVSWDDVMSVDFDGGIFLPDGEEVTYYTKFDITGYPSATTISLADSIEVCVDIEHSYLGDLDMYLISPDNKEVQLFDQVDMLGIIGWFLGDPIDGDAELPRDQIVVGECWEYCWSLDPEFGIITNELDNITKELNNTDEDAYKSLIPGSYSPSGNLQDFVGSPANGSWTLKITDHIQSDNGFICGWKLSFDMGDGNDLVNPKVLEYRWDCPEDPESILYTDSTQLVVQPSISGVHTYVMTVTDNYGCDYQNQFELDVYEAPKVSKLGGDLICDKDVNLFAERYIDQNSVLWEVISDQGTSQYDFFPRSNWRTPKFTATDFETYQLKFTDQVCETSDTLELNFEQKLPVVTYEPLVRDERVTTVKVASWGIEDQWDFIAGPVVPDFSEQTALETEVSVSEYGDYTLSYSGCDTTVAFNILFMEDLEVSNVISPNGDGVNDAFKIKDLTEEFYSYSNMSIFNRWGDEVYRNGAYGFDGNWWEGESTHQNDVLSRGTYFYVLKVGNKVTKNEEVYRGTIQLYR
jgi:gliding motility-associated-like protein